MAKDLGAQLGWRPLLVEEPTEFIASKLLEFLLLHKLLLLYMLLYKQLQIK
jgi:hypothetical protein